jgi:hypothetical protein
MNVSQDRVSQNPRLQRQRWQRLLRCSLLLLIAVTGAIDLCAQTITGPLQVWYPVTITFDGPAASETAATFRNNRMNVTFTKGAKSFTVPGYFAADGNAANTSATSGNKWRVKFTPDEAGLWNYSVSFRTGTDIAANTSAGVAGSLDGINGSFTIAAAAPGAPGFYAKGMLKYVGEHFLQFAGSGEWFVKAGPGSPEDFFGYEDFDGTVDEGGSKDDSSLGPDGLHAYGPYLHYTPHTSDWQPGDPVWQGTKGKGIIGAINYLASVGVNSLYNVILTVNGDSDTVWPWTTSTAFDVYDVSKLDQWDIVFSHMDAKGINTDVYLSESENTKLLDNGTLGTRRKIYYREMMARFGYHLGWRWCVGEEPTINAAQVADFAAYMQTLDPYSRGIGSHCNYQKVNRDPFYQALLGNTNFNGAYMQIVSMSEIHPDVKLWVKNSAAAGHKWVVNVDEPPKILPGNVTRARELFWSILTAGGEGLDVYVAYDDPAYSDITVENFRPLESVWQPLAHGLQFFRLPEVNPRLAAMVNRDELVASGNFCFAATNAAYIVYSKSPAGMTLNLSEASGTLDVRWFNPRNGGALQTGTVITVMGGGVRSLGNPPNATTSDWVALVFKAAQLTVNAGPDQSASFPQHTNQVTVNLAGSISAAGNMFTSIWSQVGGPGTTLFGDSNAPSTTATITGDAGVYVFQLAATAGTNSASDTVTVNVAAYTPDTTPPIVTITAPANGASFLLGAAINVTAAITDNIAVVSGELFVDGASQGVDAAPPYAWSVNGLTLGAHTLAVRGLDSSGNAATNTISINVSSTLPNASTITNLAAQDAYIQNSGGTITVVDGSPLRVENNPPTRTRDTYLRFDIADIPPEATINSVTLRLNNQRTTTANGTYVVYAGSAAVWVDASPGPNTLADGLITIGTQLGQFINPAPGSVLNVALTNSFITGNGGYNVVLKKTTLSAQDVELSTSENATEALRPALIIDLVVTPQDTTPPVAAFITPTNGQVFYSGQSVPVSISATDDVFVQEVYLSVDTLTNEVATLPSAPYNTSLDGLAVGSRLIIARVIDTSYNTTLITNIIQVMQPVLTVAPVEGGIQLNWSPANGMIEQSPTLMPPSWSVVPGATSPLVVTNTAPASYYRLRLP